MDEARAAELEFHVQSLQTQLETRTAQLRGSVSICEQIYGLVREAAPAIRNVDDPAARRLLAHIGE